MFTIFRLAFSLVHAGYQSACTLYNGAIVFIVQPNKPQSFGARTQQENNRPHPIRAIKNFFKSCINGITEFIRRKTSSQVFEKALIRRKFLNTDYAYCAASNDKDMVRAANNIIRIYGAVACLYRAAFMPISMPNPGLVLQSSEKIRHKKLDASEVAKSNFFQSNVQASLCEINLVIGSMSTKIILNTNLDLTKANIDEKLHDFKNPFDTYNHEKFNQQAEVILVKLSIVLAKMHALRGVDVSHMVDHADIVTELMTSFKNLLRVDESAHYEMAYNQHLISLATKPSGQLKSGNSLIAWALYILTNYNYRPSQPFEEKKITMSLPEPINPDRILQIVKHSMIRQQLASAAKQEQYEQQEFANIKSQLPRLPVETFKAPSNTDFASPLSMPSSIYTGRKILHVPQGQFFNHRLAHPLLKQVAKSLADSVVRGPAKSLAPYLVHGPQPSIPYHSFPKLISPPITNPTPAFKMYSQYNSAKPFSKQSARHALEATALLSGNAWAAIQMNRRANAAVDIHQLSGRAIVGDLWDYSTAYGLACHIGRHCNFNSGFKQHLTIQQVLANSNYFRHVISIKQVHSRNEYTKQILISYQSTVDILRKAEQGYSLSAAPVDVDMGEISSTLAMFVIGIHYHCFLLNYISHQQLFTQTHQNIDVKYFKHLQKFAIYFLDKQFLQQENQSDGTVDLGTIKTSVVQTLQRQIDRTKAEIVKQRGVLQQLKHAESMLRLSKKDKLILVQLQEKISTPVEETDVNMQYLQQYFLHLNGYKLPLTPMLRLKLGNLLAQRSEAYLKQLLYQDLRGYREATAAINNLDALKRPVGAPAMFSSTALYNDNVNDAIQRALTAAVDGLKATTNKDCSNPAAAAGDASTAINQNPLNEFVSQCADDRHGHYYAVDVLLQNIPRQFQNRVFVNMLALVSKITLKQDYNHSLSDALYDRYKSEVQMDQFEQYIIQQGEDSGFTINPQPEKGPGVVTIDIEEPEIPD